MLFTALTSALMIVLLLGCASAPTSTREDLTPPIAAPTSADTTGSGSRVVPRPMLDSPASTPEVTPPSGPMPTEAATESPSLAATPTLLEFVSAETRHFIGDPNAPVTIIEFGDFQ